ncbi:hypothetical protein M3Y97_00617700 [Aphelenchoides bicaudatus]|nr:hypothetical protein M3Y97_00617700 [Aphelenchoides bicaudatus]
MRFTSALRIILRKNGQPEWVEVRDPALPRGYKIFDYSPKYYGSMLLICGYGSYVMAQAELNPDSYHARIMTFFNSVTSTVSDKFSGATGIGETEQASNQTPEKKK